MTYISPNNVMDNLVDANIHEIHWSDQMITFACPRKYWSMGVELISYDTEGDCCSHSYFYDFYGVGHLLHNGPVTAVECVSLSPGDPGYRPETWERGVSDDALDNDDSIAVYGYRLTTEHPKFGPVSSVLSFRNSSNGWYGGWMNRVEPGRIAESQREITEDVTGS